MSCRSIIAWIFGILTTKKHRKKLLLEKIHNRYFKDCSIITADKSLKILEMHNLEKCFDKKDIANFKTIYDINKDLPHLIGKLLESSKDKILVSIFHNLNIMNLSLIKADGGGVVIICEKNDEKMVAICAWCSKVRLDGRFISIEDYLMTSHNIGVTHSMCPECSQKETLGFKKDQKT